MVDDSDMKGVRSGSYLRACSLDSDINEDGDADGKDEKHDYISIANDSVCES